MEPFRITCETCRSRLKIRSQDVIGEIHGCPKCGSMVHILPPAGWKPDLAAATATAPSNSGEAALSLSTTASAIIPASVAAEMFAMPPAATELPAAEVPAPVAAAATGISPFVLWGAGALAVLIIGGATFALWPNGDKKVEAVAVSATANETRPVFEQPKPSTPSTKPTEQPTSPAKAPNALDHAKDKAAATTPPPPPANKVEIASASKPAPTNPPSQPQPESPKSENSTAAVAPKADTAAPKPETPPAAPSFAPAEVARSADPPPREAPHQPVLKFDPLNFDPDRLGANARSSSGPAEPTNSIPDRAPAPVVAADRAAGNPADAAAPAQAKNGHPGVDVAVLPAAHPAITVRRGQPVAEGPAPKKPVQPLSHPIKSIQLNGMPLTKFVDTLSNLTGTSITLDPIALELAGVTPQTVVSLDAQDATLETALRNALTPQRLGFVVEGDHIRVALQKPEERREVDYDVKDLAPGNDASGLAELIEKFVAPTTWKSTGGAGTIQVKGTILAIEQSDLVRRQVVIFCERLRLARGLPLRSKYPKELLAVDSPYQKLAPKLSQSATFTFLAWTRISDVVRQWRDMLGVSIVVDWAALEEAQLNSLSPVACSAIDRPWQESLDGVLQPLGLAWWPVDAQTIQVTSRSALENIQRIEFYTVGAKLDASPATTQSLIDSLQKEIAGAAGANGNVSKARMSVDEPSGRLIVLATPDVHRLLSRKLAAVTK